MENWKQTPFSNIELMRSNHDRDSHGFAIPAKLYRIGEVVQHTPFTRQTIHNYTTMGLIQESDWTQGGHRLYDESVFRRLARILELRQRSKTLSEIKAILDAEQRATMTQS
ncbi:MAG TPA: MerR family transcriptional regulator [Phycisphaerales bacterium]|nr:MerR family transcriptional regulator [Phycisphaerales bacterium]